MTRGLALAALAFAEACASPAPGEPPGPAGSAASAGTAPMARWSRGTSTGATPPSESASAAPPAVDATALRELVAAAPAPALSRGRPRNARSEIGDDTGLLPEPPNAGAGPARLRELPAPRGRVAVGPVAMQAVSSPLVEQEARAQLYWGLVQRCRDAEGAILPPDAITLHFKIDPDGFIVASSIVATPAEPRFEAAAECMRRELSRATFRAPPSARGITTNVDATVPSVD